MADLNDPARRLAHLLGETPARPLDPALSAGVRQRLLARSPEAWPRLSWGLLPMAAALAALLVFFVLSATRPAPLSFTVGSGAVAGAPGDWLGSDEVETPLRFTDGTVVTVAPAGRARVTETTPAGASIMLERGSLEADVVHTGSSKWRFLAGPFEVAVTGTRFTASWDPGAERLDVTMSSGSVLVTGPVLGSARAVRAGERLSVWLRDQRMSLETIGAEVEAAVVPTSATSQTSDPVIDPPATPATSVATVSEVEPRPSVGAASSSSSSAPKPRWLMLAREGKHQEAMAALDDAAFSAALGARPSTLLELADSARLGGRPGRARDALLAARARHHVTGSTAFLLGKVSADQLKSSADALRWFETYLAEQPSGVFAEQALARILEIHSAGPGDGARAAASRYLAAHPNGSRAALARSVLER